MGVAQRVEAANGGNFQGFLDALKGDPFIAGEQEIPILRFENQSAVGSGAFLPFFQSLVE